MVVLKVVHNGDIRRLGTLEPATYNRVVELVERAWPEAVAAGARLKYKDEEGDLCTLTALTMEDALDLQPAGRADSAVLRLELQHARGPEWPRQAPSPAVSAAQKPATPALPEGPGMLTEPAAQGELGVPTAPAMAASPTTLVTTTSAAFADLSPSAPPKPEGTAVAQPALQAELEDNVAAKRSRQEWQAEPESNPAAQAAQTAPHAPAPMDVCAMVGQVGQWFSAAAAAAHQFPAFVTQQRVVMEGQNVVDVTLHWSIWSMWPGIGGNGALTSFMVDVSPWLPCAELEIQLPAECEVASLWNAGVAQRDGNGIFTLKLAPYIASNFGGTLSFPNMDVSTAGEKLLATLRD